MENMEETKLSIVNGTLDFKIHNFGTNTEEVWEDHLKRYDKYVVFFCTSVFPDGEDKETEGFLVVEVQAFVQTYTEDLPEIFSFDWAVSIIDAEGNSRFTQYSEKHSNSYSNRPDLEYIPKEAFTLQAPISVKRPTVRDFTKMRYLKKSFILDRADEFLSNGTLFLRFHIYFDVSGIKCFFNVHGKGVILDTFKNFMRIFPQAVCYKDGVGEADPQEAFKVVDFTARVLTLPQFHELRKRFGVYGICPKVTMSESESNENISYILEHVWIFDTRPHRFLLSLDPNVIEGGFGSLFLKASPVIRRCIKAPMKENREKRVELPEVDSRTFKIVMHFFGTGDICNCRFSSSVEAYKFSHMFELHNFQLKCADQLMKGCETKTQLKKIQKIAELYSDDYLFRLLRIYKQRKVEHLDEAVIDVKPDLNFYT